MFGGFGVGYGVGEFGAAGYAIEVDASAVTMLAGADFTAEATELASDTSLVQMVAASSFSIDPAGIFITEATRTTVVFATAPPPTVQTLRTAPAPTPTPTYTIELHYNPEYEE